MIVSTTVSIDENLNMPLVFNLNQNYPNPFNPSTTIEFSIPSMEKVNLEVYNVTGQKIIALFNKSIPAGKYKVEFNAESLSSGVYFYRITAGKFYDVKKMILLR
jgi:hypothetical protein